MKIPKAPSWGVVFLLATVHQLIWGQEYGLLAPLTCLICWIGKQFIDRYVDINYPKQIK